VILILAQIFLQIQRTCWEPGSKLGFDFMYTLHALPNAKDCTSVKFQ
jgi:hypothetical protein